MSGRNTKKNARQPVLVQIKTPPTVPKAPSRKTGDGPRVSSTRIKHSAAGVVTGSKANQGNQKKQKKRSKEIQHHESLDSRLRMSPGSGFVQFPPITGSVTKEESQHLKKTLITENARNQLKEKDSEFVPSPALKANAIPAQVTQTTASASPRLKTSGRSTVSKSRPSKVSTSQHMVTRKSETVTGYKEVTDKVVKDKNDEQFTTFWTKWKALKTANRALLGDCRILYLADPYQPNQYQAKVVKQSNRDLVRLLDERRINESTVEEPMNKKKRDLRPIEDQNLIGDTYGSSDVEAILRCGEEIEYWMEKKGKNVTGYFTKK